MKIEIRAFNIGFFVVANEYDICTNFSCLFAARIFWKSLTPKYSVNVGIDRHMGDGRVRFSQRVDGHQTSWIIQGPIQKVQW